MDDQVFPSDVVVGDIIAMPGVSQPVLVRTVRLGQGGFIFLVSPADDPSSDRTWEITATAQTCLERLGQIRVL